MDGIELASPQHVRAFMASEWLAGGAPTAEFGRVTLRPHQIDAVRRLDAMIATHGGAMLADEVGLGKTYVALAVARRHVRRVVVAPASLRAMWRSAAERCDLGIEFVSTESLSRRDTKTPRYGLVIVDEAHHFRTPSTRRYRALATLAARCPVLLVSATPLHNRRSDISALLAIFLGSAARTLEPGHLTRLVVRRGQAGMSESLPAVRAATGMCIPSRATELQAILALPAAAPPRDGGVADAMIARTLVRLWASSGAALRESLRRRWAKTVAMRHSLEAGRYPTKKELSDWTYADSAVQLGFAVLLSSGVAADHTDLLAAVVQHEHALSDLIRELRSSYDSDDPRVAALRSIRERHPSARIVAFSQFAETVRMYYRALAPDGGVAMLTSRGARIASGAITRREALERFAPVAQGVRHPAASEAISLLLATDLLSEGVNLQDAEVVVHLDLPWTAAVLEQRVGRAARLGSPHAEVFVYAINPPAAAGELVRAQALIRRKAALADESLGASRIPPLFVCAADVPTSEVEEAEVIRKLLTAWIRDHQPRQGKRPLCAAISSPWEGVLALVCVRGERILLAGETSRLSTDVRLVRRAVDRAHGEAASITRDTVAKAVGAAARWIDARLAAEDAGRSAFTKSTLTRRITARLARELANCPRHRRPHCSARIAAVRQRLEFPFTLGIEWEVEQLLESDPVDFLEAFEKIVGGDRMESWSAEAMICAVLVLRRVAVPSSRQAESKVRDARKQNIR